MDDGQSQRFRLELMALHRRLRVEHVRDVPLNELLVLGAVDRLGDLASPSAVAEDLKMARPNVSAVLRQLEAKGWVTTGAAPHDGRRRVASPTEAGRQVLARDRAGRERWLQRASSELLSAEEQAVLIRAGGLMQRLAQAPASTTEHGENTDHEENR